MNGDPGLATMRDAEEVLLRRCRRYHLGSPDSPGGGPLDILHLTPCGRWLRICSGVAYFQRPDAGHEQKSFRVNCVKAASLFVRYWGAVPVEVEEASRARDDEMSQVWEGLGESIALLGGPPIDGHDQARDGEAIEETIPRNSLLTRLQEWAKDWPPESGPPSLGAPDELRFGDEAGLPTESLAPCQISILRTLLRHKHRLVRTRLIDKMNEFEYHHCESDIGNHASAMRRKGLLDNSQDGLPKGYGLTEEGLRLARRLYPDVRTED